MNKKLMSRARIAFGILGFSAIITELLVLVARGTFILENFFSFFTILSNIMAVVFLIYYGISNNNQSTKVQAIRGAITLYMLMTGVIFLFLLSGLKGVELTAVPWDNIVLHYIMPIFVVLDWFINPPRKRISIKTVGYWLIFPITYVIYTLVRGSIVGWYPYPFLNPSHTSYVQVVTTSFIIAIFVMFAALALRMRLHSK
jgi:hypothetical protein